MTDDTMFYRIYLDGEITEKKARKVIEELYWASSEYPFCTIEFVINSQGGNMYDGTAIYSELYSMSQQGGGDHYVITKARGMVGSVATLIFQAGDERVGGTMDALVFHEPTMHFDYAYLSEVQERVLGCHQFVQAFLDVVEARGADRDVMSGRIGPADVIIRMPEAIELGLADRIA